MSNEKPKKRDRILKLLGARQRGSPAGGGADLHSHGAGGSSTHTPTAAPSVTSVVSRTADRKKRTKSPTTTHTPSTKHLTPIASTPDPQPGGAAGNATLKPNPTRTAAGADAAHTQVGAGGKQPISTAASSSDSEDQSLWSRAIKDGELSSQERKTLADTGLKIGIQKTASTVDAVRSIMDGMLDKKKGELWKIKFREEEVVLRDVGMKILRWLDTFKHIGDIIVQYDPGHAALPWAGFRFLLQVYLIHEISN